MNHVDEDLLLTRAGVALDAMAMGQALLDAVVGEARFRTHLVVKGAIEAGFDEVVDAARGVEWLLKGARTVAVAGIGLAVLRLSDAIDAVG